MDGHLGAAASNYIRDELPVSFSATLNLGDNAPVEEILEKSWQETCDAYRAICVDEDGCVADYDPRDGNLDGQYWIGGRSRRLYCHSVCS